MVQFYLVFGQHLIELAGFKPCIEITQTFKSMQRWINRKIKLSDIFVQKFK